jgi:hypothetical protein
MPLTEVPFSLSASPSIPASKATHGANGAPPYAAHIIGESYNLYLPHTSTMHKAMHHMSLSHHISPASPHKLQQPPMRFNPLTLLLMPSQGKHMNMPNNPTLINGYTAQQTNVGASPRVSSHA